MTLNRNDGDEPGRLELDSLAPRQRWVEGLPSLARAAARRRAERASWAQRLAAAGRWAIPLGLAVAIACWLAPMGLAPPNPTPSALLLAGTELEALVTMSLEGPQ